MFHDGMTRPFSAVMTPTVALLSLALAGQAPAAMTVHKLIGELDPYTPPGGLPTTLEGVGDVTTNAFGAYVVRGRTYPPFDNTGFGLLYGRPDAVTPDAILHEETDINAGGTVYYREGFGPVSIYNNLGQLAYGADVAYNDAFGSPQAQSLWIDNTPVLLEGDAISGLPGQNFQSLGLVQFSDAGTLFYEATYGGNKVGLFAGTGSPILKTGDVIAGTGDIVLDTNLGLGLGNTTMSPDGTHYVTTTDVNPAVWPAADPITDLLIIDGDAASFASNPTSYLKADQPIPTADGGLPGERIAGFNRFAINNNGKWGVTGYNDQATDREFVVVGGKVIARIGDSLPTESGGAMILSGQAKGIDINEQGGRRLSLRRIACRERRRIPYPRRRDRQWRNTQQDPIKSGDHRSRRQRPDHRLLHRPRPGELRLHRRYRLLDRDRSFAGRRPQRRRVCGLR